MTLQAMLEQIIKRKKNISPNKHDGFLTVGGKADSDAEGDGTSTTVSQGIIAGRDN